MDKCLLSKHNYDKNSKCVPLTINNSNVLAVQLSHVLDHNEVSQLQKYVELLFEGLDDKRRKKIARLRNRKAAKRVCSRFINRSYEIDGVVYEFVEYCEDIEVVTWLKDKYLSEITFDRITGNKYKTHEFMYMTYVIGLDTGAPTSKLCFHETDTCTAIRITDKAGLMYCESHLMLSEELGAIDRTQIYFHVKYQPRVVEIKNE